MSQPTYDPDSLRGNMSSSQSQKPPSSQSQPLNDSSNDSQATTVSNGTDRIFTPPESDSEGSTRLANGNGDSSSQESQLMKLSQLAATRQKMIGLEEGDVGGAQSRKRMADGVVKHSRQSSSTSPVRKGHSRNTSAVSMASTNGSRTGEWSAELKAKLSYANYKVKNNWQDHSIDEVESLASQAGSPVSSTSTLHGRHGTSTSPHVAIMSSTATSPAMQYPPQGRPYESYAYLRESSTTASNLTSPVSQVPTLAPPAPIQPRQAGQSNTRRNSNARYTPAYLAPSHHASPHTPAQPSPLQSTPGQRNMRTPNIDFPLFSPQQDVREQEALETLMFMSSPGNSANHKHTFPSSQTSQPRNNARTALPNSRLGPGVDTNSQGRKSLPTGRPQASQPKRVEFENDEQYGSPQARGTPRRRAINGSAPRLPLSMPAALGGPPRTRAPLREDDIERMIDQAVADDSSDSEGEIPLPSHGSGRRNGAGVGV